MKLPRALKRVAGGRLSQTVAMAVHRLPPGPPSITVLTYHRVAPRADDTLLPGTFSATPATFEVQMEIVERRADVLSMADLLEIEAGRRLRSHAVVITFDDAYRDVMEHAWPVLRRRGLPATLFVPTGFPDQPDRVFWWDRLHHALVTTRQPALEVDGRELPLTSPRQRETVTSYLRTRIKELPHPAAMSEVDRLCDRLGAADPPSAILGWEELSTLAAEGMALASHTVSHPLLTRVGPAEAAAEIRGGMRTLRDRLGIETPVFAYPHGAYDATATALAREAGIRIAFTTRRGSIRPGRSDWLRLRRTNVGLASTPALVDAELAVLPRIMIV